MIQHPETTMPEDRLKSAYADLLLTLARDEPEALERAAQTLAGDAARHVAALPDGSPGAQLARAYLAFAGNQPTTVPAEGMQVFSFMYPAHIAFEVVGAGGPQVARRIARRIARRSLAAMLESEEPVAGIDGPLPAQPAISNVVVWLGSPAADKDVLVLEGID
ncbi:MAG TPA: hypothetical protein VFR81_18055 [Longimicrobium sp.]|nr:hypothetical protein [Longimicrobium sp.]